ncbi:MAG TPA: DUF3307 domain-containing protein [bacterium]|uniref:DUF3307 domain-containing protein n=1 Tax=candidate division TA06 bacterium ADurb.Bin417 TaxID=1852828 RepID=A0A1V5MK75_UNCT6|nr:MAG: hypothetical protein BWY73_00378 [candidate division TA06 bacterium ADurb.Bin417]HNQ34708.1 DUF3307 domain-containing protein [bacterium]HNS49187.1 DUF3307 domain-containing protein [bacterium]
MNPEVRLPLLLLLFGHVVADYLCQPRSLTFLKRRRPVFLLLHGLVVLAWLWPLAILYPGRAVLLLLTAVAASHLAIDAVKIGLERRCCFQRREKRLANVIDQGLHFLALAAAWWLGFRGRLWPAALPRTPVLLNSLLVLVIILIGVKAGFGFLETGREDDHNLTTGHD